MAAKLKPMSQVKQILQHYGQGKKIKAIARICNVSKNTVRKYIVLQQQSNRSIEELIRLPDPELEELFTGGFRYPKDNRYASLLDDMDYYRKELKRSGVTRWLLWSEYIAGHPGGYSYSQFCYHLH